MMNEYDLSTLLAGGDPQLRLIHGQRNASDVGGLHWLRDVFAGTDCLFFRAQSKHARLILKGQYKVEVCLAGGWLLVSSSDSQPVYWVPRRPARRKQDADGHILVEKPATIAVMEPDPSFLALNMARVMAYWISWSGVWTTRSLSKTQLAEPA